MIYVTDINYSMHVTWSLVYLFLNLLPKLYIYASFFRLILIFNIHNIVILQLRSFSCHIVASIKKRV
jgi:hypothetical protein